jgi:uncharacterized damage-inducible protein DinB
MIGHNRCMGTPVGSARASALAVDLEQAAALVLALIANVPPDRWAQVPGPGVWSVGKDAEHLAEAAAYHQWIVRMTIGQPVAARRPQIERAQLTTNLSPREAGDLVLQRTEAGADLIRSLTEEQLVLPTRPPRAHDPSLAEIIDRLLIGHYRVHLSAIESKLHGR